MSNPLSVRRVKVQTIDANGNPEGEARFGVMAADDHVCEYNDCFSTLDDLNEAINEEGCILGVLSNDNWFVADPDKIGTDNFYGKDWTK